jgi:hypothetical protein
LGFRVALIRSLQTTNPRSSCCSSCPGTKAVQTRRLLADRSTRDFSWYKYNDRTTVSASPHPQSSPITYTCALMTIPICWQDGGARTQGSPFTNEVVPPLRSKQTTKTLLGTLHARCPWTTYRHNAGIRRKCTLSPTASTVSIEAGDQEWRPKTSRRLPNDTPLSGSVRQSGREGAGAAPKGAREATLALNPLPSLVVSTAAGSAVLRISNPPSEREEPGDPWQRRTSPPHIETHGPCPASLFSYVVPLAPVPTAQREACKRCGIEY